MVVHVLVNTFKIQCYNALAFMHWVNIGKYKILICNVQNSCREKVFATILTTVMGKAINLNASDWTEIYKSNICHLKHKKFAEFKFKILKHILPSRNKVSKWQKICFA